MGDKLPNVKVAAVQAAPVFLDREATVKKAVGLIEEAARNGANFIGFPENFIPGHPVWYYFHPATSQTAMDLAVRLFQNSVEIPSETIDEICAAAARARAYVVMGLTERKAGTTGTLYNTQLFIDPQGKIIGKHQKLVPTIGERLVHTGGSGDTQKAVLTEYGPVSGLICGENSNPFAVALLASEYTRIHVASWPNHFIPAWSGMCESSILASRNMSYMCKCFTISPCGVNSPDMIEMIAATDKDREFLHDPTKTGGSVITDPRGDVIAGPLMGNEEGILYADCDLSMTVRGRLVHDFAGHYNRSDIFHLTVHRGHPSLVTIEDLPEASPELVRETQEEQVPS